MDSGDRAVHPPPAAGGLCRSRTVDRELVHRLSVAEVLLTDVRACGDGRFEAAACWPRSHPTFPRGQAGQPGQSGQSGPEDRHSPLVLVETLRQLGIYLPLCHYGVARGARFLITDLGFALDPAAEPRAGFGASEITCHVTVGGVRRGASGTARGLRMRVRFLDGDVVFGEAWGGSRFLGAREYAALRGPVRGPGDGDAGGTGGRDGTGERDGGVARPAHGLLAVGAPADVVLGTGPDGVVLAPADARHPFLFDHGSDHVPGMALLEAARQAAALHSAGALRRPVSGSLRPLRFTEHAPRARVGCATYARTAVVRFRQGGTSSAVAVLRYA